MTELTIEKLKLLQNLLAGSQKLNANEENTALNFIFECMTNRQLNAMLIKEALDFEDQLYKDGVDMVLIFAHRTRDFDKFNNLYLRAVSRYEDICHNKKLIDTEKLSPDEYALLREMAHLESECRKVGIDKIYHHQGMKGLYEKISMSYRIVKFFEPDFENTLNIKPGLFKPISLSGSLIRYVNLNLEPKPPNETFRPTSN